MHTIGVLKTPFSQSMQYGGKKLSRNRAGFGSMGETRFHVYLTVRLPTWYLSAIRRTLDMFLNCRDRRGDRRTFHVDLV